MLNFIYYPVSAILWFWHKVFGLAFGASSGVSWALGVVFLVFTLRAVLFKPFVSQVRSMRKMQEFQPEIKKLQEKHKGDRQRLAQEMQKLQTEHGVNPLGGCLPVLLQVPVFIGLYHVLRSFNRPNLTFEQNVTIPNYIFSPDEVRSFLEARLFGAPLSAYIKMRQEMLDQFGSHVARFDVLLVSIPLMIVAAIATHVTARHSVQRQSVAAAANPQAAIMNKITQYVFPLGVLLGPLVIEFPIAILLYWLANNVWTLGQQYIVYRTIEREEKQQKAAAVEQRQALAPRPGQKPASQKPRSQQPGSQAGASQQAPGQQGSGARQNASAARRNGGPAAVDGAAEVRASVPGKTPAGKAAGNGPAALNGKAADGNPVKGSGIQRGGAQRGGTQSGRKAGGTPGGGAKGGPAKGGTPKDGTPKVGTGKDGTGKGKTGKGGAPVSSASGKSSDGADGQSRQVPGIVSARGSGRRGKKRR